MIKPDSTRGYEIKLDGREASYSNESVKVIQNDSWTYDLVFDNGKYPTVIRDLSMTHLALLNSIVSGMPRIAQYKEEMENRLLRESMTKEEHELIRAKRGVKK